MEQIKNIDERVVLFLISDKVVKRRGSLVEAKRKWWKVSEKDHIMFATYIFSVIDGIVQEVYIKTGCHEEVDDGTAYPHFASPHLVLDLVLAPDDYIRKKYKNKLVPQEYLSWGQKPIRYTF